MENHIQQPVTTLAGISQQVRWSERDISGIYRVIYRLSGLVGCTAEKIKKG